MIIDSNIITMGSKFLSIALGIIGLFLLFEVKSVVIETLRTTFNFFIIADISLIGIGTLGIMSELGILAPIFYDSSIAVFCVFFLMGILSFYKFTNDINKQIEKELQDKMERLKRQERSLAYKNKNPDAEKDNLAERLKKVKYIKAQLNGS